MEPTPSSADVYRRFLAALNARDLDAAAVEVDLERYREHAIGTTTGFVSWPEATRSLKRTWRAIPDLRSDVEHLVASGDEVIAQLRVRGTHRGPLHGLPGTGRRFEVSRFDLVVVQDGLIVERVQQADTIGMFAQLLALPSALGAGGLMAALLLFRASRRRRGRHRR